MADLFREKASGVKMQNQPSNQSTDPLYQAFANAGVVPSLVAVLGFKALLAQLALCSNLSLLWLTARCHSLHSNCNLLIALNALNTALFTFGTLPPLVVALSGRNFIPSSHCFPLQMLSLGTFYAQVFLCLAIGLDRLLAMLFPFFYRRLCKRRFYVLVVALGCYFYSASLFLDVLSFVIDNPNLPLMCSTTDLGFVNGNVQCLVSLTLMMNLVTPLCYLFLGALLRFKLVTNPNQQTRQIFSAVFALMLLQLFGWLTNQLLQFAIASAKLEPISAWYVRNIGAYPLYVALALDAPALYFFSQDYRKEFRRYILPLAQRLWGTSQPANSVATTNAPIHSSHQRLQMSHSQWQLQ